jgi:hypothetical protein
VRQQAHRDRVAEAAPDPDAGDIAWWIDAAMPALYRTLPRSVRRTLNALERAVDQYTLGTVRPLSLAERERLHQTLHDARAAHATLVVDLYLRSAP